MDEKKFINLYQRQQESGLTIKEFCSNEVIAPSTFHYWKKKIKTKKPLPGFISVEVNKSPVFSGSDLPAHAISSNMRQIKDNSHIEIEFPNKTILRISSDLDLTMLKALIHLND